MDIGYKELSGDTWGDFVNLGSNINSVFNKDNHHIFSADQQGIYFTRWDGADKKDIWFSRKVEDVWQVAVKLPSPINTDNNEDQFLISEIGGNTRDVYLALLINYS